MKTHKEISTDEPFYVFSTQEYQPISIFYRKYLRSDFTPYERLDSVEKKVADTNLEKYKKTAREIFKDAGIYPSYGYKGFYNDVIKLYENETNLDAEQQFALCKAYGSKFNNLLYPNPDGLAHEKIELELNDTLNEQQLAYFLKIFEQMKGAYLVLKTKFPDFQYTTGSAFQKYAQEVTGAYLQLLYHSSEATALTVLEANLFSDSTITVAKKMLDACPTNAVLYNYADQDTYSLYYVQAYYKYRQDVTLANMSLMVLPRYAKMVYDGRFGALPLASTIFDKFYKEGLKVLTPSTVTPKDSSQNIKNYFNVINQTDVMIDELYDSHYMWVDINIVEIPLPEGCSTPSLVINLPKFQTFTELSQLDILYSNQFKRPLCFTKACLKSPRFLFEDVITKKEDILELDLDKVCDF